MVELAPVAEPGSVALAVAPSMQPQGAVTVVEAIADLLRRRLRLIRTIASMWWPPSVIWPLPS
jgi:hypothetical protein